MHFKWQLGPPYFYHPWHDGLPTFRDWLVLLFGAAVLIFAFRQYIQLGERAGWQVAVSALAVDAWKEMRRLGTDENSQAHIVDQRCADGRRMLKTRETQRYRAELGVYQPTGRARIDLQPG